MAQLKGNGNRKRGFKNSKQAPIKPLPSLQNNAMDGDKDEELKVNESGGKNIKINANGSVTFWPSPDVKDRGKSLKTREISQDYALISLERHDCKRAWGYSDKDQQVIPSQHGICSFITCATTAWSQHYPFKIR